MVNTLIKLVPQTVRDKACHLFARGSAPRRWIKMSIRLGLSLICTIILLANLDAFASGGKFFSLRSDSGLASGNNVARPLCPEPPKMKDLMSVAHQSPILISGRFRQRFTNRVELVTQDSQMVDVLFNISVLVTVQYKTDGENLLNSVITVGLFYIPAHETTNGPGCLDTFYPNSKYILFLKPSGVKEEKYYLLSGPPVAYSEEYEQIIYAHQCDKCYAPAIKSVPNQQRKYGERLTVACSVSGNPLPTIIWIRNGQSLNLVDKGVRIEAIQLSEESIESVLEIVKLVRVDSGEYECRAKNSLGTASAKFVLQVSQSEKEEQQLMSNELVPCTEEQRYYCMNGGQCYMFKADRNVFQCRCPPQYFGDQCNFHVAGLLVYGEARDANLESMFKEMSHDVIAHLTWSIWGSFTLLAALLLFLMCTRRDRFPKKSPKRKQRDTNTSTNDRNGVLRNPLIHASEGSDILARTEDLNRSEAGMPSMMHEMKYLRPENNQRTERMPYIIHTGLNRLSMNKEALLPYPTRIPPDPLFDRDSGVITSFSNTLNQKSGRSSYGDSGYPVSDMTHTFGTQLATLPLDFSLFQRSPRSLGRPINSQVISSSTSP